ncbi:uncharacterized protein LOC112565918 [Pomacea canaliculata]|uniref:uncharacterized protein LOC112565918 n=1 Tax=Pomacea canaliculata TaxID=400727 RepID=UPI000D73230A|nr:uncharacterized protein LOC112565918 [Pomacea canaliculata]
MAECASAFSGADEIAMDSRKIPVKIKAKQKPYGTGKLSRKAHSKKAAAARWKKTQEPICGESHVITDIESASVSDNLTDLTESTSTDLNTSTASTSRRKLALLKEKIGTTDELEDGNTRERCFIELKTLTDMFSFFPCPECCVTGSFEVSFGDKMGYSRQINIKCQICPFIIQKYSCSRIQESEKVNTGFDINNAMVLCFNELGLGHAAMQKFSALVNIPGMHHKTYQKLTKKISTAHINVTEMVMKASAEAVRDAYAELDTNFASDDDNVNVSSSVSCHDDDDDDDYKNENVVSSNVVSPLDVMVSFDGTWHKRGFTSSHGVGVVIDVLTGLVLDYEVLSKHCQVCKVAKVNDMTEEERKQWDIKHKDFCTLNYEGSSKAMEKEAALVLWGRSLDKHNMRYTSMLSDGDSTAHLALTTAKVYGSTEIKKLECVNHCHKRMGAALRKKSTEDNLKGRKYGALTKKTCTKLQDYYKFAINKHLGDPEEMRRAIWATLLHCMSTDEEPHHLRCPDGPDSWCFYKKAIAAGQTPGKHKDNIKVPLSYEVARAIYPIYERMSDPNLLRRMQHGKTQNANEALNATIWARCPKTTFVGATRVKSAVASAVSHFNQGSAHLSQVIKHLDIVPTATILQAYQEHQDENRCRQSDQDAMPEAKKQRKEKVQMEKRAVARQENHEGETYGPGILGLI